MIMTDKELLSSVRVIEDFPVKGIHFQDITTLLKDPACLQEMSDRFYEHYKDKGITKVVALESRGFILGGALALRLGAGFVPARKMGKLPGEKITETYELEYGHDTIEMHTGAIEPGEVVLIHDDLVATGGTMAAAWRLVQKFKPSKVYLSAMMELTAVPKLPVFPTEEDLFSVLKVDVD